jgi:2-keto-4-pentenoate hydratase/2-oxohepta-3-ene-1,7-dioic acid hydratase in catechol pathway
MKIARYALKSDEKRIARWAAIEDGVLYPEESLGGTENAEVVALENARLLAPAFPTKIVCVGLNYLKHIEESGYDKGSLPAEPGLFLKGPNSLADPDSIIPYPSFTKEFDYEGELAVVIGKRMMPGFENPLEGVLGYTAGLDMTARDRQRNDLQWTIAKSADLFCPLGPWIETDLDAGDVAVRTKVNGETRQDGRTDDLLFPVEAILSHILTFMTLEPGDVVLTGTPSGVGPVFPGDEVEVEVEGVGRNLAVTIGPKRE